MRNSITKEHLRNIWIMVFLFQTKRCQIHAKLKHCHHNHTARQPKNFDIKNQRFILTAHVFARQFKHSGIYRSCLTKVNNFLLSCLIQTLMNLMFT